MKYIEYGRFCELGVSKFISDKKPAYFEFFYIIHKEIKKKLQKKLHHLNNHHYHYLIVEYDHYYSFH